MDSRLDWHHAFGMGQVKQNRDCPQCGRTMWVASTSRVNGRGALQCLSCEKFDPLRSEQVSRWLNGELGRVRQPFTPAK
jgi:hypothetical protein